MFIYFLKIFFWNLGVLGQFQHFLILDWVFQIVFGIFSFWTYSGTTTWQRVPECSNRTILPELGTSKQYIICPKAFETHDYKRILEQHFQFQIILGWILKPKRCRSHENEIPIFFFLKPHLDSFSSLQDYDSSARCSGWSSRPSLFWHSLPSFSRSETDGTFTSSRWTGGCVWSWHGDNWHYRRDSDLCSEGCPYVTSHTVCVFNMELSTRIPAEFPACKLTRCVRCATAPG